MIILHIKFRGQQSMSWSAAHLHNCGHLLSSSFCSFFYSKSLVFLIMVKRWPEQLKCNVLTQIHSQAGRKKEVKNTFSYISIFFFRLGHLFHQLESRFLISHWPQPIITECYSPFWLRQFTIYHLVISSPSLHLFFLIFE